MRYTVLAAERLGDGNNAGPSLTRSMGSFIGGALRYYPDDDGQKPLQTLPTNAAEILDTRTGFVLFDGTRGHSVSPFIGSRYSLVYFSISQYENVPLDQRGPFVDYPTPATIRQLRGMLAPPRGYANGLRQKSIQQAFGHAGKHQALRWHWGQLPLDVLVRIARFAGTPLVAILSKRALQEWVATKR